MRRKSRKRARAKRRAASFRLCLSSRCIANIRAPDGVPDPETGRLPNMIDRNPDEETWAAVRLAFPVLAERSDDELNQAVRPIRMVKVTLEEAKQRAEDEEKASK